jgi:hypothetical protein
MLGSNRVRRYIRITALIAGASLLQACAEDRSPDSVTGPEMRGQLGVASAADVAAAIAAQERANPGLLRIPGVVGTAVGLLPSGKARIRIFVESQGGTFPQSLDGIPVSVEVTGRIMARSNPVLRMRPAPLGFSVGHPSITAGTIGARVADGSGNVFILSNNHVLANSNSASIGDAALQPGPYDGGTSADQVGTLFAFQAIDFSGANNTMDAAIALTTAENTGNATPTDDAYGLPNAAIFGDANSDGVFDNKSALLGVNVQKYGRTTRLTKGQITGINASLSICYEVIFIFCSKSANFVDQLIIAPGTFSDGGDSGSLIVTDDSNKHPVALLFAGSDTETIANRIDLVLNRFGVRMDVGPSVPPVPFMDVAVTSVGAPQSVTQGTNASVSVTVRNVGNENVASSFDVSLFDATDGVAIGTQSVASLAVGATATRTFSWNTSASSIGSHTLNGSHSLTDGSSANNAMSATVSVNAPAPLVAMHVGDLDGSASGSGSTWSATVEITVHGSDHAPLNGATVVGQWSVSGLNANTCTTGELGGNGTCIVLFPSLKKGTKAVTFTVTSVTASGQTYQANANHDVDGGTNGTQVRVVRQ